MACAVAGGTSAGAGLIIILSMAMHDMLTDKWHGSIETHVEMHA